MEIDNEVKKRDKAKERKLAALGLTKNLFSTKIIDGNEKRFFSPLLLCSKIVVFDGF